MAVPTIDEQIEDIQEQIRVATQARSIRDGEKGIDRQSLAELRAYLRELERRKIELTRSSGGVMLIQVENE